MIPYSDFEFAINRWKARAAGVAEPAPPSVSGAVEVPMPVSTEARVRGEISSSGSGAVAIEQPRRSSGSIVVDESLFTPPEPESK
jgi:hypothetical protein